MNVCVFWKNKVLNEIWVETQSFFKLINEKVDFEII